MGEQENNRREADEATQEFLRLISTHDLSLRAFVMSLVPNWNDAQDLAQEVRIAVWEQFDQYDRDKDFGTWCRTIAYYKVLAFRKQSQRKHAGLSQEFLETVAEQASEATEDDEVRHRALSGCLQKLRTTARDLLMRYYGGQESIRQIADDSDQPYDATRQKVVRTRKWLKKCIEATIRGEDISP